MKKVCLIVAGITGLFIFSDIKRRIDQIENKVEYINRRVDILYKDLTDATMELAYRDLDTQMDVDRLAGRVDIIEGALGGDPIIVNAER